MVSLSISITMRPVVEDVASAADEDGALVTASFDGDDVDTD